MNEILKRNLDALTSRDPAAAKLLADIAPADLTWSDTRDPDAPTASITPSGSSASLSLTSRFHPLEEATRIAAAADLEKHAAVVMLGFGVGHHVRALFHLITGKAMLIIYEPDPSLLRAVLDRLDFSDLLRHPAVELLLGDIDPSALTQRFDSASAVLTQGAQFITHAPTRQLNPDAIKTFIEHFARLIAFCRTNIATTLVHAAATCHNLTHNLPHYTAGQTINELRNAAKGFPAVLVAAGPSLARNVHLLSQPGVRDRVVIIAAQTVLKPLLDRGVRPHFVTALDYHEISLRFYENLPQLDEVTLVAEPKANPAILDAFPGPVRILRNRFLDSLLGPLARQIDPLPAGSTVAHLSLYLAQHLGCDPIILIGQDLGFSDGLYYCPGTAIHDVWSNELSPFNTLEMMEFRRIMRHRPHLKRLRDVHDAPLFSDEQMLTYHAQFERDFAAAPQNIIDATEGGLAKAHTTPMSLADALEQFAIHPLPALPRTPRALDETKLRNAHHHLTDRIDEVRQLRQCGDLTLPILEAMLRDQRDEKRMTRHFAALDKHQQRVAQLANAFTLVSELNQVGVFKRLRADRAIRVADDADPFLKQRRQLERDIENVRWLNDGCDEAIRIFSGAIDRLAAPRDSACVESAA